jgi:hypothetical protein
MTRSVSRWTSTALALGLLAACGGLRGSGSGDAGGPIEHPTEARAVVLRVDTAGGFVPPQVLLTRTPDFSLFGDGTVVTSGPVAEIYPGPALPNLLQRTLTEDGIQRVLRAAARAGLLGPDRRFDTMTISDAPTTVFTLFANGRRHVLSVYALGMAGSRGMSADERQARRALLGLDRRLSGLTSWIPSGSTSAERPFSATALRLFVQPYAAVADSHLREPARSWPLAGALSTFGRPLPDLQGLRCGTAEGRNAREVLRLAREANQLTPWVSRGDRFGLMIRPLLPDESGC